MSFLCIDSVSYFYFRPTLCGGLIKFYVAGKILTTAPIQKGHPPVCFTKTVAHFLIFWSAVNPDNIPDYDTIESFKNPV